MTTVTKVLVGSRLHGLDNKDSDFDWRGVHMHGLKEVLSPWRKVKNTTWIEGDEDNTSYELTEFCRQAVHGDVTILEVFFSDYIQESTPIGDSMRANWRKFIDSERFLMASRGYASNQYNKMQLFEPGSRTPKFAVAYLRVLWQCATFFEDGRFHPQIDEEPLRQYLLQVKNNWSNELIPELTERFMLMQGRVTDAYAKAEILKPDTKWIEGFIYDAYTGKL